MQDRDAENRVDHLLAQGGSARRNGDENAAREAFAQAEAESRRTNDWPRQALALAGLGQIARDQGDSETALRHYRAAAAIWRGQASSDRLAHTIRHEADILREHGRGAEAEPLYAEALVLYRVNRGTHPLDLANAIRGYAILIEGKGEREEAIGLWREARELYGSIGIEPGVAECSRQIAAIERT